MKSYGVRKKRPFWTRVVREGFSQELPPDLNSEREDLPASAGCGRTCFGCGGSKCKGPEADHWWHILRTERLTRAVEPSQREERMRGEGGGADHMVSAQ